MKFSPERPHADTEENVEGQIELVRREMRAYMDVQRRLILRKFDLKEDAESGEEKADAVAWWIDTYSPEYEAAFADIVREMIEKGIDASDAPREISEHLDDVVIDAECRVALYHKIEEKIVAHQHPDGKDAPEMAQNFKDWHDVWGKALSSILHLHPQLLEDFIAAEDRTPDEQEEVVRKIEVLLYGQA